MPVYEYVCTQCSHRFETLRAMRAADDPIQCPECSSFETSRALSVFCAHGSGGVITGSRSGCTACSGGSCASCSS